MTDTTSYQDAAQELFPNEYVPPEGVPAKPEEEAPQVFKNEEEALDAIEAKREDQAEKEDQAEAPLEIPWDTEHLWTTEDVAAIQTLQTERISLAEDWEYVEAARKGFDYQAEVEARGKEYADELAASLEKAEADVERRVQAYGAEFDRLQGKIHDQERQKLQQYVNEEQGKLLAKVPNLNADELVPYLAKEGFTQDEINSATDHRLIAMAEKARLWDEMNAGSPTRPSPQKTRKAYDKAVNKHQRIGTEESAMEVMRAKRSMTQASAPTKQALSVREAKAAFDANPNDDTAVELQRAKRRAAARKAR